MLLKRPLGLISQGFAQNANPLYAGQGLKGHTGIDFAYPYGMEIPSFVDAFCYSVLNKGNPNLDYYRAVFTLVEDGDFVYEVSYGHCSDIIAQAKTECRQGDIIAKVGNSGDVYQYGVRVSKEQKDAGSHAGAHLHFQVRKCKRSQMTEANKRYINDEKGMYLYDGSWLEIIDYDNGYNGCIDPAPFFEQIFFFTRNLWLGMKNDDVKQLQKRLGMKDQTGFFGPLTFSAVRAYQAVHGLPTTGYVGELTRAKLNA